MFPAGSSPREGNDEQEPEQLKEANELGERYGAFKHKAL